MSEAPSSADRPVVLTMAPSAREARVLEESTLGANVASETRSVGSA